MFRAAVHSDHAHTAIDAGGGRADTEVDGAGWVNIVMGNVKRSLDGSYHAFEFRKCSERYLGKAMYRFNRRFRVGAIVPRLIVVAARCKPWPERQLPNRAVFGC